MNPLTNPPLNPFRILYKQYNFETDHHLLYRFICVPFVQR